LRNAEFLKSVQNSFGYAAISLSNNGNTNRFRRNAMPVHRQMVFAMRQNWWVQKYGVFVSMPNFTLQKREGCLDSVVEKTIMKMEKKTQRHTRGLAAQFIDFLHTLKYQHINYTLE